MSKISSTLLFLTGIIVGVAGSYYWLVVHPQHQWPIYTVASVKSHYPHPGENSETTLKIYLHGDSGHVEDLLCLFPPEFSLQGGPNPTYKEILIENKKHSNWTGIKKVRKKQKAKEYLFGKVGYYCERVE